MRRFYEAELKPLVSGWQLDSTLILVGSTTLLVAKRELAYAPPGREHQPWLILGWVWGAVAVGVAVYLMGPARARANSDQRPAGAWGAAVIITAAVLGFVWLAARPVPFLGFLDEPEYRKHAWFLASAIWLGPPPLVLILTVLRGRLRDYGWGLGRWRFWGPVWLTLTAFMVGVIAVASRWTDFSEFYPMYKQVHPSYSPPQDGWGFFVHYELAYGAYFLVWEFFFRSFMLFGLEKRFGANAVLIQMVPFTLMHIGKPTAEFFSAILAGLALGWLAWRGRSFWPCFLLHWTCAAAMDLFAVCG